MKNFLSFYFLLGIILLISSCMLKNNAEAAREEVAAGARYKIAGSFLYREKIPLPKDSVATITLSDISRADSKAIILEKQEIDLGDKSVPIKYELTTDTDNIHRNMQYAIRVEIRDKYRELLWTTDQVHLIDTQNTEQSMPTFVLKRVAALDAQQPTPDLIGVKWHVVTINDHQVIDPTKAHLQFSADGKFRGSTGCNSFSGNFTDDRGNLSFDRLVMTKRACVFQLNDQERSYIQVLNTISHYLFDNGGELILIAQNGEKIVAVQSLPESSR